MNIKYLPEEIFIKEVSATQHIWLARQESGVLAFSEPEGNFSIPVWSKKDKLLEYLKNQNIESDYQIVEFPILNFEVTFFRNSEKNEFQINPTGKGKKVLFLTSEELKKALAKTRGAT
jgi:Protein of unknown function (DUF2750)